MSEVEEIDEPTEEDDINMLGVDNDDFEIHYDRKQGLSHLMMTKDIMMKVIIKTWRMSS